LSCGRSTSDVLLQNIILVLAATFASCNASFSISA